MTTPNRLIKLGISFIVIAVVIVVLFSSCAAIKNTEKKYAVRKIEHIKGNAYLVTTDSFKVVRHVRGAGKYHRDSVSKIGIQ